MDKTKNINSLHIVPTSTEPTMMMIGRVVLLTLLCGLSCTRLVSHAFVPVAFQARSGTLLKAFNEDSEPSDYDTADLPPDERSVAVDEKEEDDRIRDALKRELLLYVDSNGITGP